MHRIDPHLVAALGPARRTRSSGWCSSACSSLGGIGFYDDWLKVKKKSSAGISSATETRPAVRAGAHFHGLLSPTCIPRLGFSEAALRPVFQGSDHPGLRRFLFSVSTCW